MSGLFVPDTWNPHKWKTKQKAQGSPFIPCFQGLLSLDICQHHAIAEFPLQGQFPCLPRLSNSSRERKPNPFCTATTEERRVPAQLCRFCWGMIKADGACPFFVVQRWHNIFADASWPGTSPLTLLILHQDPSQLSCTPALGRSLGVTPICIIAFALK